MIISERIAMLDDNPRLIMMVNKLKIEISAGRIENDWVETFIFNVDLKLKNNQKLTVSQTAKIEELFYKY
jgi:hypothetical protein